MQLALRQWAETGILGRRGGRAPGHDFGKRFGTFRVTDAASKHDVHSEASRTHPAVAPGRRRLAAGRRPGPRPARSSPRGQSSEACDVRHRSASLGSESTLDTGLRPRPSYARTRRFRARPPSIRRPRSCRLRRHPESAYRRTAAWVAPRAFRGAHHRDGRPAPARHAPAALVFRVTLEFVQQTIRIKAADGNPPRGRRARQPGARRNSARDRCWPPGGIASPSGPSQAPRTNPESSLDADGP